MFKQFDGLALQHGGNTKRDVATRVFYEHSSAQRVSTDTVMVSALRASNPRLQLTIVPQFPANLLAYAEATGAASFRPIVDSTDPLSTPLIWRTYAPPAQRLDGDKGALRNVLKYGKFAYTHGSQEYILYVADGRDGSGNYPQIVNQYLLHSDTVEAQSAVNSLIKEAGIWANTLHGEIWVFDQGFWQKQADLWRSIAKSRWADVILDEEEKAALRDDVKRFFAGQERYERYRIAWKRGIIYYGPPGNGKTISIKALSNELYQRDEPIPTLYVRSLSSFAGPEYSVKEIFAKARAVAPCLLVFEDLDSLITDQVRSYFLNEIDGLNTNQGVYMIGSTNHMDRLDPGISKRPSRFDRKFSFPKPNMEQRIQYCEYWRHKLTKVDDNVEEDDMVHVDPDDLDFPKELSPEIAGITDGFSFAYMQEAFVATLLTIAATHDGDDHSGIKTSSTNNGKGKFDDLLFWRVIKKQIELLKEQI